MCYNTLLKAAMNLGLWQLIKKSSKFSETYFPEKRISFITSYGVLQHITKGYNGFRNLITN